MTDIKRNDNVLQNVITAALKEFDFSKPQAQPVKPTCKRCQSKPAHGRMSLCLSCSYC